MLRLLFLCALLLLRAAGSEEDGSGDLEQDDDEDGEVIKDRFIVINRTLGQGAPVGEIKDGGDQGERFVTTVIIVIAAVVLVLSVVVAIAVLLVRRHKQSRQQGIYSVPTEQDQKGAV